jgi:hypothetical protein
MTIQLGQREVQRNAKELCNYIRLSYRDRREGYLDSHFWAKKTPSAPYWPFPDDWGDDDGS